MLTQADRAAERRREEAFVVHTSGNDDSGEAAGRAVRVGRPVYPVAEFS
jgi:hypothetical protein